MIDRSVNGSQVNGVDLGVGQSSRINDGDSVRIGGYLMLVSNLSELFVETTNSRRHPEQQTPNGKDSFDEDIFSFDSVMEEPTEAIFSSEAQTKISKEPFEDAEAFSAESAFGEDVYTYDPFEEDDHLSLNLDDSKESEVVMLEEHPLKSRVNDQSVTLSNRAQVNALDSTIERLSSLVERQQSALTASVDRERLFECIEVTLDKFLTEFNPESLEDEFDDYISGWGNKDKKYWSLYKKLFVRKQQKKEFKRQFTALLMEELREK
ncbi:uncharacterized protein ImpI/VasC [Vibrio astriarenae]|nr:uncharacterized protein ImpI/VasC [Vibrio sp. C7]